MLAKVGFIGFLSGLELSAMLSSYSSGTSSLARLLLRPLDEGGLPGIDETLFARPALGGPSRKMWTVSVAEDTHSRVEVELNDMLYILAGIEPLRNWYSFSPSGMLKTRIIVPFSDAVARSVPSLFTAMQDSGELCAVTMLADSILFASYTKTSPVVGAM